MVKLLVLGDVHIKNNNLDEVNVLMDRVVEACNQHKPSGIVQLGDFIDKYTNSADVIHAARENLTYLSSYAQTYVIAGNHEMRNNQCYLPEVHALSFMTDMVPEVSVFSSPTIVKAHGLKLCFCPYVPPGKLIETLDKHCPDWKSCNLVFAHQEIKGCQFGDSVKKDVEPVTSSHGDVWHSSYPMLISGHIHYRHKVSENMIYPGSCLQNNFGEMQDKSFMLLEITNEGVTYEHIPTLIQPRLAVSTKIEELDDLNIPLTQHNKGARLRLRVSGKKEQLLKVDSHPVVRRYQSHFTLKLEKMVTIDNSEYSLSNTTPISYMEGLVEEMYRQDKSYLIDTVNELVQ